MRSHGASLALVSLALAAALAGSCGGEASAPVAVRDPNYIVVRPIRRDADAEHTIQVELPSARGGYGFAASSPLFDLRSFDVGEARFAGGRTSIVGAASLWLPLTTDAGAKLAAWSARAAETGERLGVFLEGRLVAAPSARDATGGGIFVPVASKDEGDRVLKRLRNGGEPG